MRKRLQHKKKKVLLDVGEAIRHRRLELHFSQEELGELCGIHRTYVTELENGKRNISLLTLYKLAGALSIEPWKLLCSEGMN